MQNSAQALDDQRENILAWVDRAQREVGRHLSTRRRSQLGQFFTPPSVARLMAGLSTKSSPHLRLLDPGAGVGILSVAWISHVCAQSTPPRSIDITAYEIDRELIPSLRASLETASAYAAARGTQVRHEVRNCDFIESAVDLLTSGPAAENHPPGFDVVIMNPPYKKIRTDSPERRMLQRAGIETSNLYTAFVALALRNLVDEGELIAITPRSFCNGPYFTRFRKDLLRLSNLSHLHVFDSRDTAFGEDKILQETVIFRVERAVKQQPSVVVEWSVAGEVEHRYRRVVPAAQVVNSTDPDAFIHISPDEWDTRVAAIIDALPSRLPDLGIEVSTGRVVDFRVKDYLRFRPEPGSAPLIYPSHFDMGRVRWPRPDGRKPNALLVTPTTRPQLNPIGTYVLVKRFSSKEERRRIVAATIGPADVQAEVLAFENHLNYFHVRGNGLTPLVAQGLTAFLNSSLVDIYFRRFNGHTQVNANDLRSFKYPTIAQLTAIGAQVPDGAVAQGTLDEIVENQLLEQTEDVMYSPRAATLLAGASEALKALGLPKEQTNERAALTLLALLDLTPEKRWPDASAPLIGVTPIMEFAAEHYGKQWKPNTRETVRRFTLHQFQEAGLVVPNPDKPDRPVNSPAYCYQIPADVLALLRLFGSKEWNNRLRAYSAGKQSLVEQYAREREMVRIPLRIREGTTITLSSGGQNELIRRIVEEFCERFTPGGSLLYVGDAATKWGYVDQPALAALGIGVDTHGKMPDVVVHHIEKNWLVLVEAVTSHGPIHSARRAQLARLFGGAKAPLVYVTAFETRQAMNRFLPEIAWETEVWLAEAPTHLIHFNGERFLGPYE